MHTVHPGNVGETKTLQGMLQTVLQRFPVQRVILVADRGLLSLENIEDLTALADQDGRKLEFILAVPARRYADLVETFRGLAFDEDGLAEATFAGHRLIVAHEGRTKPVVIEVETRQPTILRAKTSMMKGEGPVRHWSEHGTRPCLASLRHR